MTVAPNTITLLGALFLVIPHILSLLFLGIEFSGPVPQWAILVVGVCHMIYITLDNMDGKQARRTNTSSPLGQMFDHGCDALTFSLAILTLVRYRQIGSGYLTLAFSILAPTGYFMYNIKEYYLGEYRLPFINPISEGSIFELFVNIYCATVDWEELGSPTWYGKSRPFYFVSLLIIFQIYQNLEIQYEILTAEDYKRTFKMKKFMSQFSSYFLLCTL